ncbi:3-oxoacyl-[acyl-carrier-protein] synthase III C-terminal domain-containing protein [Vallitalea sp.]|jgi:3-oxoacyl-[acyl-carrier-protein] synthase-3|uniref:3-oxoacyl-[acyl-carrier-protein] synthase III C-terminal domain-containing protein n=1 Tax=Vallitalea sp. TaxID=1882829 RepID=UPI0025CC93B7|nr:3-oxoacyl-[acyl-carrier-protein] synthase III C-terminal domain-containing protein [Vallitalea sp.]MCT4688882.1 hypothetical protein [Vallitalea sp.]
MKIGIKDYYSLLGKNMKSIEEITEYMDEEYQNKIKNAGLAKVPIDNECLLSDMIKEVYKKCEFEVELIIVAHSIPFINKNLNHISKELDCIETITLSGMPCAIVHEAIDLARKYIEAGEYRCILVIGADKAYGNKERVFFNTIMGDSVIGLVIDNHCSNNTIISSHIQSTIIAPEGELSGEDKIQKYRMVSTSLIRQCIEKCLEKANIDLKSINHIVPHTPNKLLWDTVAKFMHLDRDVFRDDYIHETGHLNSNDSFYHYLRLKDENSIKEGEYALLINPGFGGTQGCTLIKA